MWSDVDFSSYATIWCVLLSVCVLNRELIHYIHVTSQPIKPLLTGNPLSASFHRSECEISEIGWKLPQLYIQRLNQAPRSSHLNHPSLGYPFILAILSRPAICAWKCRFSLRKTSVHFSIIWSIKGQILRDRRNKWIKMIHNKNFWPVLFTTCSYLY